jgi:hypothetical protein
MQGPTNKPAILAALAMLAFGIVAGHSLTSGVVMLSEQPAGKAISPFDMMRVSRGLPLQVTNPAY